MQTRGYLILLVALLVMPLVLLMLLGGVWLWQQQLLAVVLPILVSCYGFGWLLSRTLQQREAIKSALPTINPDDRWSPAATEIWNKIEALADSLTPEDYPLTDPVCLTVLTKRILADVANHFQPDATQAELAVPLRNILFIVEQVSRDLRELLDAHIPFSHLITLKEGVTLLQWKRRVTQVGHVGRAVTLALSPFIAIPKALADFFQGKLAEYPQGLLERWLLQAVVKKIGYYAIGLYSGFCAPPLMPGADTETDRSAMAIAKRPLRVLVVGQTKAGKSSLINALLGEFRALVDVLPVADMLRGYRWQSSELAEVLIVDSPGYGDESFWFDKAEQHLLEYDLVLMVCSALHAGREADSRFLTQLNTQFQQHLERRAPPILAVLTHIDQLRPLREWHPPYNLTQPDSEKARTIHAALESVVQSLHLQQDDCIPVCLASPSDSYNIEAVLAAMVIKLPESLRAQYLRTLASGKRREKILLVLKQLGFHSLR